MNKPEILEKLSLPFHPSLVEWKPGAASKEKGVALGMAYADPRAYMNRLDELCGMEWSVTYTPWGDRVVCHLTINGVTRSSTGEADSQSERSEIAGTAAEAQAFKRACAMFGLGRYLYNLPAVWADFDGRAFTDKGRAKLEMIIAQHYRRTMDGQPEQPASTGAQPAHHAPRSVVEPPTIEPPAEVESPPVQPKANGKAGQISKAQLNTLHALGTAAYNGEWDAKRPALVKSATKGRTESSADLWQAEATTLQSGIEKRVRKLYEALADELTAGVAVIDPGILAEIDEMHGVELANEYKALRAMQPVAA